MIVVVGGDDDEEEEVCEGIPYLSLPGAAMADGSRRWQQ